jgi:predicted anti-sigma-YlaC factor YlaD
MKPECEKMEPLLSAFVDGELSGPALDQVREHLDACLDCRAALDTFRALDRLYARLDYPQPAEDAWTQIRADVLPREKALRSPEERLTAGPRRIPMRIIDRRSTRWAGVAAGALALAGMVLVAVVVFGNGNGRGGLRFLAGDNTCHNIELGTTAVGFQASLTLPVNKGDLLLVEILPADDTDAAPVLDDDDFDDG